MPVNSFDHYPLSWKPDKTKLTVPYYKSLSLDLEEKIRSGELKAGTKLPPQREIADYLDLNYTTITRVYDLCRKKGLIYGVTGKGTFVAAHPAEDVTIAVPESQPDTIEMGSVNGFSEYSLPVEEATKTVIERGYLRSLYEYSYPLGHPHQLAAGARWIEQLKVHSDPAHMAICAGAQNALTVALLSLFSPGDEIAVDPYTYSNFIELAHMFHLVLVPIAGDKEGMLPGALEKSCRLHSLKGIYLIPTCANPTTITISETRRKELADVIKKQKLILIEDDISTWLFAASGLPVLTSFHDLLEGNSVYICGMTKSLCPGLRIAFMSFPPALKGAISHGISNINIKTSSLDAEIISELILNGSAYDIARKKAAWAIEASRLFAEVFPGFGTAPCYYRWLPIGTNRPFLKTEKELLGRGVRIYHSERFAVTRENGEKYLRVALCSAGNVHRLKKGLQILKEYLEERAVKN
jgi:DNA-binding transcriptional MocR family regulator